MGSEGVFDPVRFGAFEIDRQAGQLTRSGHRVHLPPQALRLLLFLIDRRGKVVTREEIRAELWDDDTFVDVDSAVNACVSQIRAILGDRPTAPRFLETVPRRGYRFVAPLNDEAPGRRADQASRHERADAPDASRSPVRFALAMVLALLVVTLVGVARRSGMDATADRMAPPAYARTRSLDAIQKLERGRSGLADASPTELLDRVKYFEAAIRSEPDFAEAYSDLADAKLIIASYRAEPPQLAYPAAKAAAAKALALDPHLADAHAMYAAAVLFFEWDWVSAREHFARAESLSPGARVHHWHARALTASGRHGEALAHAEQVVRLDPTSPSALTYYGVAAYYAGDASKARQQCSRAVELMPEFTPARMCLEAVADPARSAGPATPDVLLGPAVSLAAQSDRDQALDWLQRAANRRSDGLVFLAVHPGLAPLRHEPRFASLIARVGLGNAPAQGVR
jgi:DNA-binding winged helix-turn-helix (wHTH) protein